MELLPYVELRDPETGRCVRPFDNCATLAGVRPGTGWKLVKDIANCDECCAPCEDTGAYTGDPETDGLFWAGTGDPAEADAIGVLVDRITLEPPASVRRVGETSLAPPPYSPRILAIDARLIGSSRAATYFLENQMLNLLRNECGSCDGWEMTGRAFCPDVEPSEPILPPPFATQTPPPLLEDDEACGPCERQDPDWEPNLLGPSVPTQNFIDNGRRTTMRVRFLSMDTAESEVPLDYCFGSDVRIVFEVFEDYQWGDPIEGICALDDGWDTYGSEVEEGEEDPFVRCRPPRWDYCLTLSDDDGVCITDPQIQGTSSKVESVRSPIISGSGRYCSPLYRSVRACLTPEIPTSAEVVAGLTIDSGSKDLRNLMIEWFPAFEGYPSPATCEGERFYRSMVPCRRMMIPWLQQNSSLSIDGRSRQVQLSCLGSTPMRSEGSLEGWDHSPFRPDCRYWMLITADCLNTASDMNIDVLLHPRWLA